MSSERPIARRPDADVAPEPSPDDIRVQIDLRLKKDDLELAVGRVSAKDGGAPTHDDLNRMACKIYDARRQRERMLNPKLFGEPGWDMLLALYCLPTRGEQLGITALSLAAGAPMTTALRWQNVLMEDGLIERTDDESDRRRSHVQLTEKGRILIEDYLMRLHHSHGSGTAWP